MKFNIGDSVKVTRLGALTYGMVGTVIDIQPTRKVMFDIVPYLVSIDGTGASSWYREKDLQRV